MWTYEQKTGWLSDAHGRRIAQGYSGMGIGKNNPEMQSVHDAGPIPQGAHAISNPADTLTHGPYVLPLTPDPGNEMFGRKGFLIHGDSVIQPGTASEGCIILPRFARERIWESDDHLIQVAAEANLSMVTDPDIGT
jgi:hypothetical protein